MTRTRAPEPRSSRATASPATLAPHTSTSQSAPRQHVHNYGAPLVLFEEGDVVTGNVVRIDKDEVLVDIGYKSEGVIPSNELSIRKSIDPSDEVSLGEEVDALVLTK